MVQALSTLLYKIIKDLLLREEMVLSLSSLLWKDDQRSAHGGGNVIISINFAIKIDKKSGPKGGNGVV